MSPEDPRPDPRTADRDRLRYEVSTPLTVITARAQLLQRQLLRANGLVNLERDQMLGNLAALLAEVELMSTRIESMIDPDRVQPETPASVVPPSPTPGEPA